MEKNKIKIDFCMLIWNKKIKRAFVIGIIIILLFSGLNVLFTYELDKKSIKNMIEVKAISKELTWGVDNEYEKVKIILNWINLSFKELYHTSGHLGNIYYSNKYGLIFCPREIAEYSSWVFFTQCGKCGEYSFLFNNMANASGLKSRIVTGSEDHSWNELFVENRWVIVDPSLLAYDSETVNLPIENYLNHRYYFAEYPNRTKVELTIKYLNETCKLMINSTPIKNDLKIYLDGKPVVCDFNSNNFCEINIKAGNYTIIGFAKKEKSLFNYYSTEKIIVLKNQTNDITLNLKSSIRTENIMIYQAMKNICTGIFILLGYWLILISFGDK